MTTFGVVAGSLFGLITYVQRDDVHGALLWFVWGIAFAALNEAIEIRRELRQQRARPATAAKRTTRRAGREEINRALTEESA